MFVCVPSTRITKGTHPLATGKLSSCMTHSCVNIKYASNVPCASCTMIAQAKIVIWEYHPTVAVLLALRTMLRVNKGRTFATTRGGRKPLQQRHRLAIIASKLPIGNIVASVNIVASLLSR